MATKSELILALEQIEREKGIKVDDILKMIEGAVGQARPSARQDQAARHEAYRVQLHPYDHISDCRDQLPATRQVDRWERAVC